MPAMMPDEGDGWEGLGGELILTRNKYNNNSFLYNAISSHQNNDVVAFRGKVGVFQIIILRSLPQIKDRISTSSRKSEREHEKRIKIKETHQTLFKVFINLHETC